MRHQSSALIALALVGAAITQAGASCGSSSGGGGAGGAPSGSGGGGTGGVMPPDESCVRPGDEGNDKGVGTYCSPHGRQCDPFPEAGLCLADVGQNQWFCTRIGCTSDDQCGMGATCLHNKDGDACVPDRCLDGTPTSSGGAGGGTGGTTGTSGGGTAGGTAGGTPTPTP